MGAICSTIRGTGVVAGACLITLALIAGAPSAEAATDGSYQDIYWVHGCSYYGNAAPAFGGAVRGVGFSVADDCIGGHPPALQINAPATPSGGSVAKWAAVTPSDAVRIIRAWTPNGSSLEGNPQADCALHSDGYDASFFWGDNGTNYGTKQITVNCGGAYFGTETATGINQYIQPSRYLGWQVTCTVSGGWCSINHSNEILDVTGILLEVQETSGPSLDALGNNLWYQSGWVRGVWSTDLQASDPSGVCAMQTTVNGAALNSYADLAPDSSQWSQCPGSQLDSSLDTSKYPDGAGTLSLSYSASNAAGASSSVSKAFNVDNAPVSVTLGGPTDALSTAGPQDVTATATAGPSGVAGIACSLDGAPYSWSAGPSAQVAVEGIGTHTVTCYAQNNALDAGGQAATSPSQTWTLSIRQPSISELSLAPDIRRCHRVRERVRVPARWVTGTSHGKPVRVRLPARTVRVRALECQRAPTHGRLARARVVRFGRGTTVNGWVGTYQGIALGNQTVLIFAAPADGSHRFRLIATAKSATDGSWSARLRAGPSRELEAVYPGSATVAPSASRVEELRVPASLALHITPRTTRWGGTIRITGRLRGGYVPPAGELVVLWVGWPGGSTEIGHVYARRHGRFHARYTFLRGHGTQTYALWAATTSESDYPYARATSGKVAVTVEP